MIELALNVVAFFFLVGVAIVLFFYGTIGLMYFRGIWKQHNCEHERHYENRACHGVCYNCGKDLGFIGNLKNR